MIEQEERGEAPPMLLLAATLGRWGASHGQSSRFGLITNGDGDSGAVRTQAL